MALKFHDTKFHMTENACCLSSKRRRMDAVRLRESLKEEFHLSN